MSVYDNRFQMYGNLGSSFGDLVQNIVKAHQNMLLQQQEQAQRQSADQFVASAPQGDLSYWQKGAMSSNPEIVKRSQIGMQNYLTDRELAKPVFANAGDTPMQYDPKAKQWTAGQPMAPRPTAPKSSVKIETGVTKTDPKTGSFGKEMAMADPVTGLPVEGAAKWMDWGTPPSGNKNTPEDADAIAQSIIEGKQPPTLQGLYRGGLPVRAALAKKGYDLAGAQRDWNAVQKQVNTLNGPQQTRLRQAVEFTYESVPLIEDLYSQLEKVAPPSQYKMWNKASLTLAKNMGGKTGEIAQNLEAQINDLVSELGTVYKGGNSSTDESLRLAEANLKSEWNPQTFKRAIAQIKKNLQVRRNSIYNTTPAGLSQGSQYWNGGQQEQTAPQTNGNNDPLGIR